MAMATSLSEKEQEGTVLIVPIGNLVEASLVDGLLSWCCNNTRVSLLFKRMVLPYEA